MCRFGSHADPIVIGYLIGRQVAISAPLLLGWASDRPAVLPAQIRDEACHRALISVLFDY